MSDEIAENSEFAQMIGLVVMHWNKLHDITRSCFPAALGGNAIFTGPILDAIRSDDTQRRVILAAISAIFSGDRHTDLRTRASDLFNKLGSLSSERNGFVHSSWTRMNGSPIQPNGTGKKVHGSLTEAPLEQGLELLQKIDAAAGEVIDLIVELQNATAHQSRL